MPRPKPATPKLCTVEGCSRKVVAKGLCNTHYHGAWRKKRGADDVRECESKGYLAYLKWVTS